MRNLKKLSRDELINVSGGLLADNPTGDYKCCWSGTSNCSIVVHHEDHGGGSGDLVCLK